MGRPEDIGGSVQKLNAEILPVREEEEDAGMDITSLDRPKRPRLTSKQYAALANCNRPLEMSERRETSAERQRAALEL